MNHTAGPWRYEREFNAVVQDRGNGYTGKQVCVVNHHSGTKFDEVRANAVLIAAAPELLEALKGLLALETRYTNVGLKEFGAARAALAKAEG